MTASHQPFVSRLEQFGSVDSTQLVVREWLDEGVPEVAVAVADTQFAGRGRHGRSWVAPAGAALLVSCGLRPSFLSLSRGWQLAATASLAMLDAAEDAAGLREGAISLKWPNDLVADGPGGELLKLGGVLGQTVGDGDRIASAVVGLGVNADWQRVSFPPELASTMTSLRELAGGRPIDREALLHGFLDRLEPRYEALREGRFDAAGWSVRQRQTGALVEVVSGTTALRGRAVGVDPRTGALVVESEGTSSRIDSGEVVRCRLANGDHRP